MSERTNSRKKNQNPVSEKPTLKTASSTTAQNENPDLNQDGRKNSSNSDQKSPSIKSSFFDRFISAIKTIKLELLFGLLALILSLGQYFQSGISVRINITSTWREGYTSDIRNRVSKFRYLYKKKWQPNCGSDSLCMDKVDNSVRRLASQARLFSEDIGNDEYIRELISEEIEVIRLEKNREPTRDEYIQIALKYRNAIIECLNTAEAVKAVIEARPLFRWHILYSDTLEGRYRDIIEELKNDLMIFITSYREATPGRETEAWYVLTSKESKRDDYFTIALYVSVLILILTAVYFVKRRVQFGSVIKRQNS